MTQPDRKALIRAYKENPRPAGIFQVKNTVTGRVLIGPTADLSGMLNRQRFQLEMGSHPDKELQADWNELGADAFEFGVLDTLEPGEDASITQAEDLRALHRIWLETLDVSGLYRHSVRGT